MPFCPKCGQPVSDGSRFCGSCGAAQRTPATPARPATPAAPARPAAPVRPAAPARPAPARPGVTFAAPRAPHSPLKWLIPVIAIAAAVAAVVVILMLTGVIGKSDEELIRDRIAAFEEAYTSGDYDGMMECMDSQMQSVTEASMGLMDGLMGWATGVDLGVGMSDMFGLVGIMGDFADFIIDDIEIDGDNAVVTLTMNMNMYGETMSEQTALPMVKEKGDWYIGGVTDVIGTDLFDSLSSFY
ncbi:MAG: zinc ribbon domain-containing protein [Clostridia bacterium]|nr:zinc ribbon domain-containing protein [Clostridia bacterium]